MEKFVPYEKLSKKEKRKIDKARRQTWGELNPVTRKPENSKAYNRNKARNWKRELSQNPVPGLLYACIPFLRCNNPKTRRTCAFPSTELSVCALCRYEKDGET